MRNTIILLLLMAAFACNSAKNGKLSISEGLEGTVYWVTGNQMPSVGNEKREPKKPIVRTIYICPPMKMDALQSNEGLFQGVEGKQLQTVQSDEKGRFSIALKPGKYSVFVKEEGGFFANNFDGDGYIQVVEIKAGEVVTLDILVNYTAAY